MATQEKAIKLYLTPEMLNHTLEMLSIYEGTGEDHEYIEQAIALKQTILRFAKKRKYKGEERAMLFLYEREFCVLVKLSLFFSSMFMNDHPHDYYAELGTVRTE